MATHQAVLGAVLILLTVAPARAADPGTKPRAIRYEHDRLSVHLENVELGEVVEAIGRATGAEIRGEPQSPHPVSVAFEDLPVLDALTRLLEKQPFSLRYRKGHLSAIELVRMATVTSPSSPQEGRAGAASPNALERPITVEAPLIDALGEQSVPPLRVVDAALQNPDAEVREQAARAALGALESDADLRRAFLASWGGVDPRFVAQVLGATPGGEAFITYLTDNARSEELRTTALGVLRQMRGRRTEPPS